MTVDEEVAALRKDVRELAEALSELAQLVNRMEANAIARNVQSSARRVAGR